MLDEAVFVEVLQRGVNASLRHVGGADNLPLAGRLISVLGEKATHPTLCGVRREIEKWGPFLHNTCGHRQRPVQVWWFRFQERQPDCRLPLVCPRAVCDVCYDESVSPLVIACFYRTS